MKGTAILFHEDKKVTFIENIDHGTYEKIKEQCGCDVCNCILEDKVIHFDSVSPAFWHEEEVDWDYGY